MSRTDRLVSVTLTLALLAARANADSSPPAASATRIVGGEHPGFRAWVERYMAAHQVSVREWWAADADGDGRADNVALACHVGEDPSKAAGVMLIERADGARSAVATPPIDYTGNDCDVREWRPHFIVRQERSIHFMPSVKRSHESTELAFVDGQLVVVGLTLGGFHIPDYDDWGELDLRELVLRGEHQAAGEAGSGKSASVSERSVLLVGADEKRASEARGRVVRGRRVFRGEADAALRVALFPQGADALTLKITVVDDRPIEEAPSPQGDRPPADRVAITWNGRRAIELVRAGGTWQLVARHLGDRDSKQVAVDVVHGDTLSVTVPAAWFRWLSEPDDEEARAASEGLPDGATWGAVGVAFYDVDEPGAAPHVVVATGPLAGGGRPRGVALRLPHDARFPLAEEAGFPSLATE